MAAAALRQQGFSGPNYISSDEAHLPYERPPLSKAMLLDDNPQLQPVLPASWWQEHNVQLHLGVTLRVDRASRTLTLADGQTLPLDSAAAGDRGRCDRCRCWMQLGDRCFTLRHAGDAERLRTVLQPGNRWSLSARAPLAWNGQRHWQRGCRVTLVELADTVIAARRLRYATNCSLATS
jgi:3-phenylpropionate/trans-cinnamate dioxygenase ferredoxin reductase subunit